VTNRSSDHPSDSDRPTKQKTVVTVISSPNVAAESPANAACLVIIYGADLGKRVVLDGSVLEIGRSAKCELPLDQESVSRRHARCEFQEI
jgi:pSer/pThr/pTyr-binding forkhead associated (FHA) protein